MLPVVSTTLQTGQWNNTQKIIKGNVVEEIAKVKQEPGDYILVPGSATLVQLLMETDLLVKTESLPLGVIALFYESVKNKEGDYPPQFSGSTGGKP